MSRMLYLHVFPHEVHVISRKIVHRHKWRDEAETSKQIRIECRKTVHTRLDLAQVEMKNVVKHIIGNLM